MFSVPTVFFFFFFNDTATTEIYTLSLHDALPIFAFEHRHRAHCELATVGALKIRHLVHGDGRVSAAFSPGGERIGLREVAAEDQQGGGAREDVSNHGAKSNEIRDGRG